MLKRIIWKGDVYQSWSALCGLDCRVAEQGIDGYERAIGGQVQGVEQFLDGQGRAYATSGEGRICSRPRSTTEEQRGGPAQARSAAEGGRD